MKKYSLILFLFFAVSFLFYCFFPVVFFSLENEPWRIFLKDRNWVVITDKANEFWYKKIIELDLDSRFVKDLIKIEDKNFYSHYWIDFISKLRALKDNIINKKIVNGGSTITEQYIKNHFFKNNKRTYLQKAREWFLAFYYSFSFLPNTLWENESYISFKNRILSQYLHNIYFWNNLYWIWAAIEVYFWKNDLSKLSSEEITLLISLINNPWISSLDEEHFSSYFKKVKDRLWYDFENSITKLNKKENIDIFPFVTNNFSWDFENKTTIDAELSSYTKQVINKTLEELKFRNVTNAAVFAIDPKTREVLIYQWSKDFYSQDIDWQVDVLKSYRQLWSTLKPFLYLLALESWAWSDDLIIDLVSQYDSFQTSKTYISNNYSLKEYWLVRLKKALGNSFNNSSVRLAKELWLEKVYDFYKKYRFNLSKNPEFYWYSLVLWNPSLRLKDLVFSYSKLLDLKDKNKFLLYDILSNPDNRDVSFWVNSILNTSIYQAVKTWTSSDFRDNVIVSYHPDFVIWVWVWNNDNSSMIWVTWISWAWYIWHSIIEKAISMWYIKDREIDIPEEIKLSKYCLDEKCFRSELNYSKDNKKYFSRLADNLYSKQDIFEKLSSDEVERLKDFQIFIGN